jgi:hypothetical protein
VADVVGVAVFVVPDKNLFLRDPYDKLLLLEDDGTPPIPLLFTLFELGAPHWPLPDPAVLLLGTGCVEDVGLDPVKEDIIPPPEVAITPALPPPTALVALFGRSPVNADDQPLLCVLTGAAPDCPVVAYRTRSIKILCILNYFDETKAFLPFS